MTECSLTTDKRAIPQHVEHSLRRNRSQTSKDSIKDNQVFTVNVFSPCLRSRFTTSYEASEITRVTRVNISKIAYENAERRLSHRIWATALLKLIYLEMFGYDMSWAAFHVLEVMSSQNYLQKRVGYLGAVQSFRPDTEVLMLTTNLLKKDMVSPLVPTMSLPLSTLPHIISPSLALSLLSDLLPRLSHSHPSVRKKSVVNLYRLSLVYPEALRLAWPKMKERLMDEHEDSSVTAAVINVVCELGWRRPRDFLPLAPRLFGLLVDGGNNWMAIKIVKLFASLTPLEPRLVRKLLRPLTTIIQTTSAMSLLCECINGVIQGGILEGSEGVREGEVIAHLCVEKLRAMLVLGEDPNLKYVALLAFNRIALSHPMLVSQQQDVLMDCLDDNDVSIRLQALQLVSRMVTNENLQLVVDRLITQLRTSPLLDTTVAKLTLEVKPSADIEGEDPEEPLEITNKKQDGVLALPADYRVEVLKRILEVCSQNTYSAIVDFEWYVDVLVQLMKLIPPLNEPRNKRAMKPTEFLGEKEDLASQIGFELRNVAVRVRTARPKATRAAESLVLVENRAALFPITPASGVAILEATAWVAGEFSEYLFTPEQVLSSLIHPSNLALPSRVLSSYLQTIPKIFVRITSHHVWSAAKQSEISTLLANVIIFLDKLSSHPDLDVQERALEFLELFHITAEAISTADPGGDEGPLLLYSAIPRLFSGLDLNPVAADAQRKVPVPNTLDLESVLDENVPYILRESENSRLGCCGQNDLNFFYHVQLPSPSGKPLPKETLAWGKLQPTSYQNLSDDIVDTTEVARRRAERKERNDDDPFYIRQKDNLSGPSSPLHHADHNVNSENVDIDSIPIVDLALESAQALEARQGPKAVDRHENVEIIADETIDLCESPSNEKLLFRSGRARKPLLEVDSSRLGRLPLEEKNDTSHHVNQLAHKEFEAVEMAEAMARIERVRLEMQRVSERIHIDEDIPPEGTLVKRKKKKKGPDSVNQKHTKGLVVNYNMHGDDVAESKKKKKKKKKKQTTKKETPLSPG
ncbi:hypothetical protein CPC735_044510 [Coccidioides posadasii C735 delta SOWgp]|uniref:AP-3 complex subunit delta n=2 Tax=Coccidioides posadasii TaxID=199306 RepID=C5PBM3_COCP7|nr:hypothetical protein CPC735_044510 [Coccidioides posadasii C735 delta SOWgp]EER26007.1 hypothetical protein CPC735_044510 [Coccidioides posadasii C735 delta SOWgp]|eukprot:XP_003068152.1 hypothetical protein CPC735_044510 [Coccidioides posadasii C735 delta SOWgp]